MVLLCELIVAVCCMVSSALLVSRRLSHGAEEPFSRTIRSEKDTAFLGRTVGMVLMVIELEKWLDGKLCVLTSGDYL